MKKILVSCLLGNLSAYLTFYLLYMFGVNYISTDLIGRYWIIPFMVLTGLLMLSDYKDIKKVKMAEF